MGNCIALRLMRFTESLPGADGTAYTELEYPMSASINKPGKLPTVLHLPAASCSMCCSIPPLVLSAAALPGLDPLGQLFKPCQDVAFCQELQRGAVVVGVFDGHGPSGLQVVRFAREYVLSAFLRKDWWSDPQTFLYTLTKDLDAALSKQSGSWDAKVSGTTEVLALLSDGKVYVASVGDSRVVMGTKKPFFAVEEDSTEILKAAKKKRSISIDQSVKAVQLTKDHSPNDPYERSRIQRMGGSVRRLTSSSGNQVGPWRVWKKGKGTPGLALSRSLGDTDAKEIGITAEPDVTAVQVRKEVDRFVVAASDGVWNVMNNAEVATFVETYRSACVRFLPSDCPANIVDPRNSSIARLLCEEARVRWLALAEADDTVIDDISCVVLEFDSRVSKEE